LGTGYGRMSDIYSTERQNEIINSFKTLLKEADNFPRDKNPTDYKIFWTALRSEGSNLLGLTHHLLSILETEKVDVINE
jgi:hypothetical protein